MKIIGLHGAARSGKNTVARYLAELISDTGLIPEEASFADPIKQATAAMFSIPVEYLYDDDMKDKVDPYWGMTYREMAQGVGNESSRLVFFSDIWVRNLEKRVLDNDGENKVMLITDIRFDNEAEWVLSNGGIVIRVRREEAEHKHHGSHASEAGIDDCLISFEIDNNGTLEELKEGTEKAWKTFEKNIISSSVASSPSIPYR